MSTEPYFTGYQTPERSPLPMDDFISHLTTHEITELTFFYDPSSGNLRFNHGQTRFMLLVDNQLDKLFNALAQSTTIKKISIHGYAEDCPYLLNEHETSALASFIKTSTSIQKIDLIHVEIQPCDYSKYLPNIRDALMSHESQENMPEIVMRLEADPCKVLSPANCGILDRSINKVHPQPVFLSF